MPLTHKDQQLWNDVIKDVQPLDSVQIARQDNAPSRKIVPRKPPNHPAVDLHGMTLADAHARIQDHLHETKQSYKFVTIITGKSGQLRQDVPRWIEHMPGVRKIDPAEDLGSVKVWFKNTRQKNK